MIFLQILAFLAVTAAPQNNNSIPHETPAIRSYFYVGGNYISDNNGGHIFANQMYVEKLSPINNPGTIYYKNINNDTTTPVPVILIHGQAQTGTNFLNKPDGNRGWASQFLEAGHTVYILDQTARGRSAVTPGTTTQLSTYSAEYIESRFTAPQRSNLWPQAKLYTQWPGAGIMGDAIFDAFYASNVPFIANATAQQTAVQAAGAALLDRIGRPVWLVGHSQGGLMAPLIADARPQAVKGLVLLEPTGPPFRDAVFGDKAARKWGVADVPVAYEPRVVNPGVELVREEVVLEEEGAKGGNGNGNKTVRCLLQARSPPPRQLVNLKVLKMLVVTSESGYHAVYDQCTVAFLRQAGVVGVEHLRLEDVGMRGNGHFMFLEKNSKEIWEWVSGWMEKNS
ncbi:MhpC hydrolase or acyltransferase alpha beta hydrolase superfamily [Pyrenophora tritici-repentis]|uniref:Alpha/beta hydrolase fold n=1 Tax=Pyrenophora tritici-repentis TaxID=45151 RepID=A0A2W1H030_9PLEO|nr:MhpC hydrolase or acyltransferase [Pyrenophora tritici-repentis]KAF7445433.1 MhpC hydrolase or acyltransferase [Pyrenophora tritici-repentis]KAF7565701.1 MhpC, hydrolase or acyltransferase (alpha-beta hydrolase superfamily) [Pyrenophora tritici-repentis]KAG9380188.1 MhpC hydrolase or acyltransferase [Pyrenophora tritici-repentis]KAI0587326.1 MhpC hydrolase or acyltransferase (alpha-beta hydrolase superfamily) [Pyrenophora tritici-repentis]